MTTSITPTTTLAHARARFLLVGFWVPFLALVGALVLQLMWLSELPIPAAIHFSGRGGPDGFGPAWTFPVLTGVIGIGMLMLSTLPIIVMARRGQWSVSPRLLGAIMAATVVMLAIGLTLTVNSQRGLTDATKAPDAGPFILLGAAIGLVYGVAAWFLQPALTLLPEPQAVITPAVVASGTKTAWMQTARVGGAGLVLTVIGVGTVLAMAIVMTFTAPGSAWVLWATAVLMFVLFASMFVFRVRIDETGFHARSIAGIPSFHIPREEIAEVRSLTVNGMADFGGWGLRYMPGSGTGIILRTGEALQIVRTNGKKFTVTVQDSVRAAELLLGLREHATP